MHYWRGQAIIAFYAKPRGHDANFTPKYDNSASLIKLKLEYSRCETDECINAGLLLFINVGTVPVRRTLSLVF